MKLRLDLALLLLALFATESLAQSLPVEEATIVGIHAAMRAGKLTCRDLVQSYLDRIAAYDKRGPALNSIITINPRVLVRAAELDADFARRGLPDPFTASRSS